MHSVIRFCFFPVLFSLVSVAASAQTYVGSFSVNDGPYWGDNPPVYSGQEAAALIFGGSPADYRISTNSNISDPATITDTAWTSRWGIAGCHEYPQTYRVDLDAPGYNVPGGDDSAISAYVSDNCIEAPNTNYVWRTAAVIKKVQPVPTLQNWALLLMGLIMAGAAGLALRRRS